MYAYRRTATISDQVSASRVRKFAQTLSICYTAYYRDIAHATQDTNESYSYRHTDRPPRSPPQTHESGATQGITPAIRGENARLASAHHRLSRQHTSGCTFHVC